MASAIGFIGVGEIAGAIVEGLYDGPDPTPEVHLSPRGASRAAALARRYPQVTVCPDNQSVVDAADLVVLSVRPEHVDEVLSTLELGPGSLLVSAVAGESHASLRWRLGGHVTVVRVIPLPAVRRRTGITVVHPPHPDVAALFDRLGGTLEVTDPGAFDALSASTATISAQLSYLSCVARWTAAQGVPPDEADRYVRSMFSGVALGMTDEDATLEDLMAAHETPHGTNEQLRTTWFDPQTRAALVAALDAVHSRITRPPGDPGAA